jgi:ABC-type lipoprotein release transport system permease subunit
VVDVFLGSVALARVLEGGIAVRLWDPWTYFGVWLLLVAVALGAMLGPTLRAAGADPNQALRQD